MKILFITFNGINDDSFGGGKCSKRNYRLLCDYGEATVFHISKKSNFQSLISILEGFFPPANIKDYYEIKKLVNSSKYDLIFFDASTLGSVVSACRKSTAKLIVFYHNCEFDYINVRFGNHFSFKKLIYKFLAYTNEKQLTKICDARIVLSERDKKRIFQLYGTTSEYVLPLSLNDTYEHKIRNSKDKFCLLFGASNTANDYGYKWFIDNVSPHIKCNTLVAGKGYDRFESWQNEKVKVIGFVEDVAQLYSDAECVVIPLFSGGGMKIKTLEGLMYGKTIFGTDEAFEGFDDEINQTSVRCNSKEEYIRNINKFLIESDSYNKAARGLYLEKYSDSSAKEHFRKIIDKLNLY